MLKVFFEYDIIVNQMLYNIIQFVCRKTIVQIIGGTVKACHDQIIRNNGAFMILPPFYDIIKRILILFHDWAIDLNRYIVFNQP